MSESLTQALSIIGAVVILAAYSAQAFKLLVANGRVYLALNFIGGVLLCLAAIKVGQIGFIILEGAWALISLIGLLRVQRADRAERAN
jgi:hypothetical protein